MNVAVVGASQKPDRYSYMAVSRLRDAGHRVFPVHKQYKEIQGIAVFKKIEDIKVEIDTVTVYVQEGISSAIADEILKVHPKRIIFNPGAENPSLMEQAKAQGIETLEACTLVLLSTGQFSSV